VQTDKVKTMDELLGASVEAGPAELEIAEPLIDRRLLSLGGRLVADRTRALLEIPSVATFAVEDGRRVRVQAAPGTHEGVVAMWMYGVVAALVLAQRGRFAVHASVVEVAGAAVAIAGRRRAGKSTAALRLSQRGHRVLIDDVAPVIPGNPPMVVPFERPVHIFEETADELGLDTSLAEHLFPEHPKLSLSAEDAGPIPLAAVIVLAPSATQMGLNVTRARGARALWMLVENAYRNRMLTNVYRDTMFAWAGEVARTVPVYAMTRSATAWTVDEVADAVLENTS
jgi:hypothetical protein